MKTSCKNELVVCLAVAVITFAGGPLLYAQASPGTDPGVQPPPPVPSNFITCFSSSIPQPDRGIDSGQFGINPNGLPSGSNIFPIPLQGILATGNGQNGLNQLDLFCAAAGRFQEIDSVSGVVNPAPTGNCTPIDLEGTGSSGTIPCVEGGPGLGPRFNGNSCTMCHFSPMYMGAGAENTSTTQNAEATSVASVFVTASGGVGNQDGGTNSLAAFQPPNFSPALIGPNTPNREVRFIENLSTGQNDFNVHQLFTITGRVDATNAININPGLGQPPNNLTTCAEGQPNFAANLSAANPNVNTGTVNTGNVIFRIPITTLGDGLVELIDDEQLELNLEANEVDGVGGPVNFNRSGNDGTITRFGWKAQNKSLLMFSGEAYNVEVGVSNDLFPNERRIDDDLLNESLTTIEDCQFNPLPDDTINFFSSSSNAGTAIEGNLASQISSDITNFATAMRLSNPPLRNSTAEANFAADLSTGEQAFITVGCTHCHTDVNGNGSTNHMVTIGTSSVPVAQGNQAVNAFSDFAIHTLSTAPGTNSYDVPCLNDQITQGLATGGMFRSAPLWGLSTRKFLLHDGSETDLVRVIKRHACSGSEANEIVTNFFNSADQKQLLEFLRTL